MADLKSKLKSANKLWKGAKKRAAESPAGFVEYEDGRYMARLIKGEIGTSDSGRLQLVWSWKFDEEPYEGKIKKAYQGLETEDNLVFLARDLERLGYEAPDDLAGLEPVLADIAKSKPLARIRLRSKGDFQNVYIDKVFGDDDEDENDDDEDETEDTDTDTEEESDEDVEDSGEEDDEESDEESDDEESDDEGDEESDEESDEEESDEEESDEESDDEDEDGEAEEDSVDVEVGMTVEATTSKGKIKGKIIEIFEDDGKVKIQTKDGSKVKVGVDKIELATPDEPEKKPAKKADKKPAKKETKPAGKKKVAKKK